MKRDWAKYYQKRFDFHLKREMKDWAQFKKKNHILVLYVQQSEFLHIKYVDRRAMTAKVLSFSGESIYDSSGYTAHDNKFKLSMIDNFDNSFSKYREKYISNFVEKDIPRIKHIYQEKFDNPNEIQFSFGNEPEFFEADNETILDFIADCKARDETMNLVRQENQNTNPHRIFNEDYKPDIEDSKGLTVAQVVLVFGLLNDQNKISKHQDRIRFARFIAELTGRNEKNVKDTVNKYFNDISNGNIHKTEQRNIDDYERVRSLFEMIDNQDIVKGIDKRIEKLKKQMINR